MGKMSIMEHLGPLRVRSGSGWWLSGWPDIGFGSEGRGETGEAVSTELNLSKFVVFVMMDNGLRSINGYGPLIPINKASLDQTSLSSAWLCSTCGSDKHARQIRPQTNGRTVGLQQNGVRTRTRRWRRTHGRTAPKGLQDFRAGG